MLFNSLREACAYCRVIYENGKPVDFVYLDVNESFLRETGLTDVIGKKVTELLPDIADFEPDVIGIAGRVALSGKSEVFESYLPKRGVWLSNFICSPQKEYFIGVFENITERKRAEQALRESEQQVRAKLDAILAPEGDLGTIALNDVLDIPAIRSMMETFHKIVNITIGIADTSGKLLISVGRQDVCNHFHCANPESLKLCVASHTVDCSAIPSGQYRLFKCQNNMWNVATPIVIGGHEIGKLMAGEFLLEEAPFDEALFRDQARRYGYDEGRYMQKLAEVPRIRRELVDNTMNFFMELANMISQLGYNRITLARSLGERIRLMDSLREREEIFSTIFNQAADGMALIDVETLWFAEFNEATCQTFGYTREEFASLTLTDLITDMTRDEVARHIREVADAGRGDYIAKRRHHSGRLIDMNISTRTIRLHGRDFIAAIWRDVTEQRRAEEALRLSEQRFRDVSEAAGEFIWELDSTGRLTYLSDRVESVLGFKPEELVGTPAFGHMPAFEIERYKTLLHDPETRAGGFHDFEHCLTTKAGEPVWVSATAVPMRDSGGALIGFRGATLDISQRKRHEREINRLNRLYETLSELNKTVTHVISREELFREVCRISVELAGFQVVWIGMVDEETMEVKPVAKAGQQSDYVNRIKVFADDRPVGRGPVGICIREGWPTIFNEFATDSRSALWHEAANEFGLKAAAAFPIYFHGKVIGAFAVYSNEANVFQEKEVALLIEAASDISFALENIEREEMRRQAVDALRNSEAKFRSYIEHSPMAIYVFDSQGNYVEFNQAALDLVAYTAEQAATLNILDLLSSKDRERGLRDFGLLQQLGNYAGEYEIKKSDGTLLSLMLRTVKIAEDRYLGFATDMTDRKRAEQDLRESEAKYRGLFENSMDGILLTLPDGQITAANPAACAMFGMTAEEICGLGCEGLVAPSETRLLSILERRSTFGHTTYDLVYRRKDGTSFYSENTSALLDGGKRAFVMIHDITKRKQAELERQKLQAQLLQSQKMEAIGQLAGGVAHDFNNLLTVIMGYSEMLLTKLPVNDPNRTYVADIHDSGERAAALTRQLLAFSRKQILAPKILNLNLIIVNLEKMLRRLIGENLILTTELSPAVKPVEVDPGQIEQVVINLAVNARDAMQKGGQLFIETGNCLLDADYCRLHPGIKPGEYVFISMTDTGCGMDEEVRSKIFEPFFTTKEQGRGTGLGLATVFGIIKQSGGTIDVISEPGVGSCFKIYLPSLSHNSEFAHHAVEAETVSHIPCGNETILLVEDETAVRKIARLALETHGYRVIETANGKHALEVAENPADRIDLLVSDVVMPEMSGPELAEKLQKFRPGLKVLYMSGYTDDEIFRNGLMRANAAYLQKPFAPVTLARRVREILDAAQSVK